MVLKGRPYTVTLLNQLPDELNLFKVTSKENPSTIGFFGEINPLSNFYPASFTHDGLQYISSEQFIQARKAQYFGDIDIHSKIMGCSTSLECKAFSKQIRNIDEAKWEEVARDGCYPGIKAKFYQNPDVMDCLMVKTGSKRIVECATDRLWATGVPLNDPTCLDETKWMSPGILGQMLESIRTEQALCLTSAHTYQQQGAIHSNTAHPPPTSTVTSLPPPLSDSHAALPSHGTITPLPPPLTNSYAALPSHGTMLSALHTEVCPAYDTQVTPMEGLSSSTDPSSSSASASTTPVSDTTETDTDSGEAISYVQQN